MIFWCIPFFVIFYMLGGQINKYFRPVGIVLTTLILYWIGYRETFLLCLPATLYMAILLIGYGVNSKLMKWLKSEQAVRIVLGLFVALPVVLITMLTHNWIALVGAVGIVAVSTIRLGQWGSIGGFEILPVDILRGTILGIAVSLALM